MMMMLKLQTYGVPDSLLTPVQSWEGETDHRVISPVGVNRCNSFEERIWSLISIWNINRVRISTQLQHLVIPQKPVKLVFEIPQSRTKRMPLSINI